MIPSPPPRSTRYGPGTPRGTKPRDDRWRAFWQPGLSCDNTARLCLLHASVGRKWLRKRGRCLGRVPNSEAARSKQTRSARNCVPRRRLDAISPRRTDSSEVFRDLLRWHPARATPEHACRPHAALPSTLPVGPPPTARRDLASTHEPAPPCNCQTAQRLSKTRSIGSDVRGSGGAWRARSRSG